MDGARGRRLRGAAERRAVQGRPVQSDLQTDNARARLCPAPEASGKIAARRACGRSRISGYHRTRRTGVRCRADIWPMPGRGVIGTHFYVMEMVEGRIFWDPTFPEVGRDERPAYFDAMNATIASLHGIDPDGAGLGDYGKPGNYFA